MRKRLGTVCIVLAEKLLGKEISKADAVNEVAQKQYRIGYRHGWQNGYYQAKEDAQKVIA